MQTEQLDSVTSKAKQTKKVTQWAVDVFTGLLGQKKVYFHSKLQRNSIAFTKNQCRGNGV